MVALISPHAAAHRVGTCQNPAQLLLFGFLGLQARVRASGKLRLEFLNPTGGIHVLQLAGIKRVARVANVDANFRSGATGYKRIPATAGNLGLLVLGMNVVFHRRISLLALDPCEWWLQATTVPVVHHPENLNCVSYRRYVAGSMPNAVPVEPFGPKGRLLAAFLEGDASLTGQIDIAMQPIGRLTY